MTKALSVIILTHNETLHIRRAVESALKVTDDILIVDSFSTDDTVAIAHSLGARVVQHEFVNQAAQMQWAMEQNFIRTSWIMRLDADEYLTDALVQEINLKLPTLPPEVSGVELTRQVHFMGQWIRHGGYYPIRLLRIWRAGHAVIEQRWMDEHTMLIQGTAIRFSHDFIDDNLQSLTWWTQKHNQYATREAIDILNRKYNLLAIDQNPDSGQAGQKRWFKNNLYLKMPLFLRAFLYFQFRFWIRLGFLDGRKGLVWHFLQGFWYRFLVDAKLLQIEWWIKAEQKSIKEILREKYGAHFITDTSTPDSR